MFSLRILFNLDARCRKKIAVLITLGREVIERIPHGLQADCIAGLITKLFRWFGVPRGTAWLTFGTDRV